MYDAGAKLRAQILRLLFHGFKQIVAGDIGQAGIVGDAVGVGEPAVFWPMTTTDLLRLRAVMAALYPAGPAPTMAMSFSCVSLRRGERHLAPVRATVSASPGEQLEPWCPQRETLTSISRPR